jgi:hypothetical protein
VRASLEQVDEFVGRPKRFKLLARDHQDLTATGERSQQDLVRRCTSYRVACDSVRGDKDSDRPATALQLVVENRQLGITDWR